MKATTTRRKILIIEDEPSIRNALYVLLAGLGCEGDIAYSGRQALAMISREKFDAVVLDLRCRELSAEQVVSEIREIRPSLVGRVLVITSDVADPEALEMVERHCLPHVPQNRMMQELWSRLRPLLGIPASSADTASSRAA